MSKAKLVLERFNKVSLPKAPKITESYKSLDQIENGDYEFGDQVKCDWDGNCVATIKKFDDRSQKFTFERKDGDEIQIKASELADFLN